MKLILCTVAALLVAGLLLAHPADAACWWNGCGWHCWRPWAHAYWGYGRPWGWHYAHWGYARPWGWYHHAYWGAWHWRYW